VREGDRKLRGGSRLWWLLRHRARGYGGVSKETSLKAKRPRLRAGRPARFALSLSVPRAGRLTCAAARDPHWLARRDGKGRRLGVLYRDDALLDRQTLTAATGPRTIPTMARMALMSPPLFFFVTAWVASPPVRAGRRQVWRCGGARANGGWLGSKGPAAPAPTPPKEDSPPIGGQLFFSLYPRSSRVDFLFF